MPTRHIIELIQECVAPNNFKNINNEEYKELYYIKKYIYMFIFYYLNKNDILINCIKALPLFSTKIIEYIKVFRYDYL